MFEIKTYYKTQAEIAETVNKLIDGYWNNEINDETLLESVEKINRNNRHLLYKFDDFTSIVKLRCGKRRLELLARLIGDMK